jgi:hypothetical protein
MYDYSALRELSDTGVAFIVPVQVGLAEENARLKVEARASAAREEKMQEEIAARHMAAIVQCDITAKLRECMELMEALLGRAETQDGILDRMAGELKAAVAEVREPRALLGAVMSMLGSSSSVEQLVG